MSEVRERRRVLASALARLADRPDTELAGVPDHVVASWRRSLHRGVDPAVVLNRHHPELDLDSRLVRCARPVLDRLHDELRGAAVCVALTDDRAHLLLRRDTTVEIGRSADANGFAQGFGYDEGVVGTNGVGTVLEAGGPVHIVGAEHFVESLHGYACAGAPVRDPVTGRIVGVLDVSCRAEQSSPVLLSLVVSAAARIQDALLHDRDPGQQAVFDLYTRVDARSRDAVLAVGRSVVLANAGLQALVEPVDLAALQAHARFRSTAGLEVDDRLDLPSGARVRLRGTVVVTGSTVAGLVAVVQVVREAPGHLGPVRSSRALASPSPSPSPSSSPSSNPSPSPSPAWRTAQVAVAQALRTGVPLLVVGEAGSGRRRLLADLDDELHGPGHVVEAGSGGEDLLVRLERAGPNPLVVLVDVDRWVDVPPDVLRTLHVQRPRLAATAVDRARCSAAVAELLGGARRLVALPPLRHRPGDLPSLVAGLLDELAPHREVRLSPEALRTLVGHGWPGNVTELRGALEQALHRRPVGEVTLADLPESCQSAPRGRLRPVDQAERDAIVAALRQTGGNRAAAAVVLGLARSTLYRKIAQYRITA